MRLGEGAGLAGVAEGLKGWLAFHCNTASENTNQQLTTMPHFLSAPFSPLQVSDDIMFMLTSNLFRALHPLKSHDQESFDAEEEEPNLEPAWPHLQVRVEGGAAHDA